MDNSEEEEEEDDCDCDSKSTEGASIEEYDGNKGGEEEDNEEDNLKFILELEDNWGESQSLFNPSNPPQN